MCFCIVVETTIIEANTLAREETRIISDRSSDVVCMCAAEMMYYSVPQKPNSSDTISLFSTNFKMVRNYSPRRNPKQLFEANRLINTWSVYVLIRDEPLKIACKRSDLGRRLLERVCRELSIEDEADCFGLKYIDINQHRFWIDMCKPLYKQIKYASNFVLSFEYQFYPAQQELIISENSRLLLFLQLCNDINQSFTLFEDSSDRSELAALALQGKP
ncbi:hypothetical protein GJ496_008921 [Pomphorhynchus laevis]|nr:hypothetical protein GJ496_008921 [Pomphorhynchus laevis]